MGEQQFGDDEWFNNRGLSLINLFYSRLAINRAAALLDDSRGSIPSLPQRQPQPSNAVLKE